MICYKKIPIDSKKYSNVTLAIVYNKDTGELKTGIARKSVNDHENNKKAKKIALGRVAIRPFSYEFVDKNLKSEDVFKLIETKDFENKVKNDQNTFFKQRLESINRKLEK